MTLQLSSFVFWWESRDNTPPKHGFSQKFVNGPFLFSFVIGATIFVRCFSFYSAKTASWADNLVFEMSAFEQSLLSEMLPTSARNSAVSLISGTPSATVPIPMPRPSSLVPCPGSKLRWNLTASEILQTANDIMAKSKAVHDAVGALRPNQITYETVIKVNQLAILSTWFSAFVYIT